MGIGWTYHYTARSEVSEMTNEGTFAYDLLGRLDTAQVVAGNYDFDYDANGNRTALQKTEAGTTSTESYSYAPGTDRVTSVSQTGSPTRSLTWDAAGRLLTDPSLEEADPYHRIKYAGNALGFDRYSSTGWSYGAYYNHLGQRDYAVWDLQLDPDHDYYFGGLQTYDRQGQLVGEYGGYQTPLSDHKEWVYLNGEPLAMFTHFNLDQPPYQFASQHGPYYYHNDRLGTPQVLTNASKAKVWQAHYKPFGEAVTSINLVPQPFRFPGQYADMGFNVSYNYHRYYDPSLGRYTTSDPIGFNGGLNAYAYAAGDPINHGDPSGLGPIAFVACSVVNGAYQYYSVYKPLKDLDDLSRSLYQDQLDRVNQAISECPADDIDRFAKLSEMRADLIQAAMPKVGEIASAANGLGLRDVASAMMLEGVCAIIARGVPF